MPVERRSRRLFILVLAVPVIFAVYLAALTGRAWAAVRPAVALVLGVGVIGTVYAEEAWRRSPAPRVSPVRTAAVLALALVVAGAGLPTAPASAASPSEAVIEAAKGYLGIPYRLGRTGPDLFDCSGLMFRIFADAGELPRIGGKRMRAIHYYNWFKARGMISTDPSDGERGDLVYYTGTSHIGIYLGDGKVLSAMVSGVKVHGLQAINPRFVAFLKVNWSVGDPDPGTDSEDNGNKDKKKKDRPRRSPPSEDGGTSSEEPEEPDEPDEPADTADKSRGLAVGTMNLRESADPHARIIGWVSRGSTFQLLDTGHSPSGALWFKVKLRSGKVGWVYSRWAVPLDS